MKVPFLHFISETRERYIAKPIRGASSYIETLSPGDRFISLVLALLVICASTLALYMLQQHFLVKVPAYGGSVVEGVLGSPRFVHPLLALSDADRDLVMLTYAGLMGYDNRGNLIPVIASSYEIAEDQKTYTFFIKEQARFSDGSPVTAEDVVFTVTKAQDPSLKSPELSNWANIRAEIIDAKTVRFTLPKPYAPFLEETTLGILPAKIWKDIGNEEFPFSPYTVEPVGAGPFEVVSLKRGENGIIERYEMRASPTYALGRPFLDAITLIFFSQEEDLSKALVSGRVKSAHSVLLQEKDRAAHQLFTSPYTRVFGIFFNQSEFPALTHIEVRKVLSLLVPREAIVTETLSGFGTPLFGPVPQGTGISNTDTSVFGVSDTDSMTRARNLLEENGWVFDETERLWSHKKESSSLSMTLKTSNVPELKDAAAKIQRAWESFGIPTTLELYEPGDLTQNVIRPRNYSALFFGMVIGHTDDLYAFWHSSERTDPGLNIALYTNSTVDGLLEQTRETKDQEQKRALLQTIEETIATEFPAAFTHAPSFLYVLPKTLQGVSMPRIATPSDRFYGVHLWHIEQDAVWPWFASSS